MSRTAATSKTSRLLRGASVSVVALVAALSGCGLERHGLGAFDGEDGGGGALPDGFVPPGDGGTDSSTPPADGGVDSGTDGGATDGGFDAGPFDGGCTSASESCTAGTASVCDPTTGTLVARHCALGCATAAPRCARLVPSNVPASLFAPTAADVLVSGSEAWDTTACARPGMSVESQLDGGDACVWRTGTFTMSGAATVQGQRPLVILAEGAVTISGTIDVSARGRVPGPGGYGGGVLAHHDGYGPQPGRGGDHRGDYEDGGGGGGALCGEGGAGGVGDDASGGAGGSAASSWELAPLHGGSGGGLGQGAVGSSYDNTGYGGAGGGALQISSQASIALSGRILAGGGGGDGGKRASSGSTNYGAGGGGGAGGAVLLEAPVVDFPSSGAIVATGGGGGGSASDSGNGDPGQDGAETTSQSSGGTRAGYQYGADGGDGGGGSVLDGETGDSNTNWAANGGGGGGGAGCILIRNADGAPPAGTDRFSPSTAPGVRALTAARD